MRAVRAAWPAVLLGAIIVAGLALRLINIDHGLPFVYQSDEAGHFTNRAVGMFGGDFDPGYFRNPSAYTYAIHLALRAQFGVRGVLDGPQNVIRECLADPSDMYLTARVLAAVLCMLSVPAVYVVGRRLWGVAEGLVAAAVLAFAFLPLAYSRYALTDVGTLLPVTLAVYGAVRAQETGRLRYFALAGAAAGLAVGFKYTTGVLAAPIVAAALLAPGRRSPVLIGLAVALAAGGVAFLVTNPYFLVRPGDALSQLQHQSESASRPKFGQSDDSGVVFYLRSLTWGLGWGAAVAAAVGAVWELRRNRRRALVLLLFPLLLLLVLSVAERFFARWLMPAYPVLALFAGVALARLAARLPIGPLARRAALAALLVLVLVQPVAADVRTARLLGRPDTRTMTWNFLVRTLPYRTKAVVEPAFPPMVARRWLALGFPAPPPREGAGPASARFVRSRYPGLIDRYRATGTCVVVTFESVRRRIESSPRVKPAAYYRRLERESTVIFRASPYRAGARRPPFDLDKTLWLYYPSVFRNPGPEAVVYRLHDCRPAQAPRSSLAGPSIAPSRQALIANPLRGRSAGRLCRRGVNPA